MRAALHVFLLTTVYCLPSTSSAGVERARLREAVDGGRQRRLALDEHLLLFEPHRARLDQVRAPGRLVGEAVAHQVPVAPEVPVAQEVAAAEAVAVAQEVDVTR